MNDTSLQFAFKVLRLAPQHPLHAHLYTSCLVLWVRDCASSVHGTIGNSQAKYTLRKAPHSKCSPAALAVPVCTVAHVESLVRAGEYFKDCGYYYESSDLESAVAALTRALTDHDENLEAYAEKADECKAWIQKYRPF